MKITTLTAAAIMAVSGPALAQEDAKPAEPPPAKPAAAPEASTENVSYAIGVLMAGNLKQMGLKPDVALFSKGLADALEGKEPKFSEAQCQQIFQAYRQKNQKEMAKAQSAAQEAAQKTHAAQSKAVYDKALAAGDKTAAASSAFLAENAKRKGVTTTASGLQYEVVKAGTGAKPSAADTVNVHYHGTLPDGTVFDSSVERNEPISFPLLRVIPGWTEGVQLMPTGSKYKFFIPSYLAYGEDGSPPKIPGHSALVFEVELLKIEE